MTTQEYSVEQAMRRSHCDRSDRKHECVGTMRVTPSGVEFDCQLCGSTSEPCYSSQVKEFAHEMARLFGLQWDRLSHEVQQDVLSYVYRDNGRPSWT